MADRWLLILILAMAVRDGLLLARHRRPFRAAFVLFWLLLGVAHVTRRGEFYPFIGAALLVSLWMRYRELKSLAGMLEEEMALAPLTRHRDPNAE